MGECGLKIMTKLLNTFMKLEVAQELHGSYNDCFKEEATSYKIQRPSHSQPYRTHSKDT
jgi:hypothetical protein